MVDPVVTFRCAAWSSAADQDMPGFVIRISQRNLQRLVQLFARDLPIAGCVASAEIAVTAASVYR